MSLLVCVRLCAPVCVGICPKRLRKAVFPTVSFFLFPLSYRQQLVLQYPVIALVIIARIIRITMGDLPERLDAYLRNLSELLGLPQPAPQPAPQPMAPQPAPELDTPPCPTTPAPVEL